MKEGYIIHDLAKAHFIAATVVDWNFFDFSSRLADLKYNRAGAGAKSRVVCEV